MKKLLAILLSCVMITAVCASCEKEGKDDKESKSKSSAVSDDDKDKDDEDKDKDDEDKDKDDEDKDKDDDDKDKDDEDKDKDDEDKDKDDEDKDKDDDDKNKDKDKDKNKDKNKDKEESKNDNGSSNGSASVEDTSICGSWTSDDLMGAVLKFDEDGTVKTTFDYSEVMCFKDGKLEVMGTVCDTTFDGSKIEASMAGQVVLSLERTGAKDDSTMDGEYTIGEGMGDESLSMFGDLAVVFEIEGEKMSVSAEMGEYTADGKTLVLKGGSTILSSDPVEEGEESCEYTIEGDTLTLVTVEDGENVELTRVK